MTYINWNRALCFDRPHPVLLERDTRQRPPLVNKLKPLHVSSTKQQKRPVDLPMYVLNNFFSFESMRQTTLSQFRSILLRFTQHINLDFIPEIAL